MPKQTKGFTLIELLIVIAIVAVLSVVVILTLNPAELLRQARDSNRISDLSTIKSALSLYLADGNTNWPTTGNCYVDSSANIGASCVGTGSGQSARFVLTLTTVTSTSRLNNGNGWLPVNFTLISSGSPVPQLPTDPVRDATNYYAFSASSNGLTFEINARMESTKYNSGTGDVEANDGGNKTDVYEVGTDLAF